MPARVGVAGAVLDRARRAGVADPDAPDRAESASALASAASQTPIDALNVARAALQEGLDSFPAAHLDGPELDLRLLVDHRERLVRHRVELNSTLLWHLHDLWPELQLPGGALFSKKWTTRIGRRLARAEQTMRVRIARDMLRRLRELTATINQLEREITELVEQIAPQLLAEPGFGPLIAAKLVGEIAGAQRFATPAKLARAAGVAPIPASSGNTQRHRLDQGGNRQINAALHRVIVTRARCHQPTRDYIERRRREGKSTREAIRCLKRYLARHVWRLLQPPLKGANIPVALFAGGLGGSAIVAFSFLYVAFRVKGAKTLIGLDFGL